MAIIPVLQLISASANSISVKDATGSYNSSNPGGFGTPNPSSSDVGKVFLQIASIDNTDSYLQYSPAVADMLSSNPVALTPDDFPGLAVNEIIPDGVYDMKYDLATSYGTITITPGSNTFQLANANTILAGAVGIYLSAIDDSHIWILDLTSLSATGGSITENFPTTAGTSQGTLIVYEGDLKLMIGDAGANSLRADLALWSDMDCDDDDFRDVWKRYKMQLATSGKFQEGCYVDAHRMLLKLASYSGQNCCRC